MSVPTEDPPQTPRTTPGRPDPVDSTTVAGPRGPPVEGEERVETRTGWGALEGATYGRNPRLRVKGWV